MTPAERAGFLDESPGVKSSTRLIAVWLVVLATVVVGVVAFYVVYGLTHKITLDQFIVLALAGVLGALVASGAVAIINRSCREP